MPIVNVRYVTNDPASFIPRDVLTVKGSEKIWLMHGNGKKPPVELYKVLSNGNYLGLDMQYIRLEVSNAIAVEGGDILTLGTFDMYVSEVIPD